MSESMIHRLRGVGIDLDATGGAFRFGLRPAGLSSAADTAAAMRRRIAEPLVSCLMVTRGDLDLVQYSVACYRRQTYPRRELVVVTDAEAVRPVEDFLRARGVPDSGVIGVAPKPGLTLGDLRNIAVAHARGDIMVQWDDDDLFDPRRIEGLVAVLTQSEAAAAFLSRWLVWWPERRIAAVSNQRIWEGSMAVWRDCMPVYPAAPRGEDSAVVDCLARHHTVALIDLPCQYVYAVTGRNTWTVAHFETLIDHAACVFRDAEFDALNRLLSRRLPVLDYAATLGGGKEGLSSQVVSS